MVMLIVPLSVAAGARKGLLVAATFGIGVAISMTVFGVFTAGIGAYFGINAAVKQVWVVAGVIAYAFALSQLGLFKLEMPFKVKSPRLSGRTFYVAPFIFGLMLGDAGIGCPSPAFFLLVTYIISSADLAQGAILGFLHGFGRATPLFFLATLALLGTNVTKGLAARMNKINAATGIGVLLLGSFIITIGLFGDWFVLTIFDKALTSFFFNIFGSPGTARDAFFVGRGELTAGWQYGPWITLVLFIIPMVIWAFRRRSS